MLSSPLLAMAVVVMALVSGALIAAVLVSRPSRSAVDAPAAPSKLS